MYRFINNRSNIDILIILYVYTVSSISAFNQLPRASHSDSIKKTDREATNTQPHPSLTAYRNQPA